MKSEAGMAVASLGQIVVGYAAVFGRKDKISLRDLEDKERGEFLCLVRMARRRVEQRFGQTVMFEHGAVCSNTKVSCGVNRIHVHVVPYAGRSLKNELEKQFRCTATAPTIEQMWEKMNSWGTEKPYFWIEEGGEVFLFSYGKKRESQVIRRVLAAQVGLPERWDWRQYPTHEVAERVARELLVDRALEPRKQLPAVVV